MKLKRKKKKSNMPFIILGVMTTLLIAITLITYSLKTVPSAKLTSNPLELGDERAEKIKPGIFDKISKNKSNEFTYEINTSLKFKEKGKEGEVKISNPYRNTNLMQVEIALKENEIVIFRSGLLAPGEKISSASLDYSLPAGKYEAMAYICAVSPDTFELLGFLEQPVNIKIDK